MIAAGGTVQAVVMPIMDHNMPVRVEVKALTAIISAELVPVIAVRISAPAELAPIGPAVRTIVALCAPVRAKSRSVELPINLAVDLAFNPVAAMEMAVGGLGDRGSGADQRYGQGRSDDLAHAHCLSPFLRRSQNGHGLYASSTLERSWESAAEPRLTGNVRIRSARDFPGIS
jgi:hypothetical protein